ncbi:MAG: DHH family phosphoesterase [Lachnospira sp.]|nr:DHH family phosphoesterase [Lachnospira sp.]
MKLSSLDKYSQIVIQVHDNPDADAVGSGYAIYDFLKNKGKDVRLVYGGRNEISKSNMKLMVNELHIPIEYVGAKETLDNPELLITVDCQYGEGNVQKFAAQNIAMIDHHSTGKNSDDMCEIRSNLAGCATVCYSLLKDEGFDINKNIKVATALYYGLYMDSNQMSEISHPLDKDMADYVQYDKVLLTRLKYANFSISELETAGIAITNNNYNENTRTAVVKSEPCDPNILGVIGDFVIQVDSIDVCIIYNECTGGYKLSVRSCALDVSANELVYFLTRGVGDGGGHLTKAGGFINKSLYEDKYVNKNLEEYIMEKMDEYYQGFNVVRFTEEPEDFSEFVLCRKKKLVYGYVPSTDIFAQGTECKIRTLEGDVTCTAGENIYLMIGYVGEVYPIEKNVFESKYTRTEKTFVKEFEYAPTIINTQEGKVYELMTYAKECKSEAGRNMYAKVLDKYTKVFTRWDYEGYMVGHEGDMLCYSQEDSRDVYIVKKDIFEMTYEII